MVVASLSSVAESDSFAKASFESSGSIVGFSSSSTSSHQSQHVVANNENANKISCSSSSTEATSRNSCERVPSTLNTNANPASLPKPHKAQDDAWASIQSLKSKVGDVGMAHFKILCRLGHGDIGRVFLAQLKGTQSCFAMKVMDKEALTQRKKVQRMYREREILEFVDHPFLPTLYAHFEADQFSCLVMDYCAGGDLHALRQKLPGRRFGMKASQFYAAEVLVALEYLHMLGIVYRDLKPENVLVRGNGHIMLTDFDLSFKCDVEPKLLKCPLSSSTSSSSGRFGLLRSFSMSSSMSSGSISSRLQQTSMDCMLPSTCSIHPLLSCLPPLTGKSQHRQKPNQKISLNQKNPLSMLFLKQSVKVKPKVESPEAQARLDDPNAKDDAHGAQEQVHVSGITESQTVQGVDANLCADEDLMGVELVAEPTQARSMSFVGTHEYLSPEMIAGQGHGNAVDWWTFGIFLFELLYGKTPFKGASNEQTLMNIIKQPLRFPEWGHIHVGEHAKSLIEGLLMKDPKDRLGSIKGASEIKQHPFFRGVNWALIRSMQPPQSPNNFVKSNQQHGTKTSSNIHPHFDYF
ncbi:hypothetical protein KP509_24G055800 [Ceratopteris richardii]|uniref:non-specific serine/threonine protein kinase n=1 Tax=Ceratopteris richardii TaxID=49495 RepID=A0A8T2RWR8_CERRI|nr:hypothetical protein KP509_24G055800 [Ceratopteris richardii]